MTKLIVAFRNFANAPNGRKLRSEFITETDGAWFVLLKQYS
jgi:hypothetical protein